MFDIGRDKFLIKRIFCPEVSAQAGAAVGTRVFSGK